MYLVVLIKQNEHIYILAVVAVRNCEIIGHAQNTAYRYNAGRIEKTMLGLYGYEISEYYLANGDEDKGAEEEFLLVFYKENDTHLFFIGNVDDYDLNSLYILNTVNFFDYFVKNIEKIVLLV